MTSDTNRAVEASGWRPDLSIVHAIGVLLTCGVFLLLGGVPGFALGVGIGLSLVVLPELYAFALSNLVLAVLLPDDPAVTTILVGEVGLLGLLVAPLVASSPLAWRDSLGAVSLGGVIVASGLVAIGSVSETWLVALLVVGLVAVVVYGLHRYAVVRFEESTSPRQQPRYQHE